MQMSKCNFKYKSTGKINFRDNRLVLETDPEISKYYQWFLVKAKISFIKPRYAPHITIVSDNEYDFSKNGLGMQKSLYEITFNYSPKIKEDKGWLFIPVEQFSLEKIRFEYGLDWCYDVVKGYHISLGKIP